MEQELKQTLSKNGTLLHWSSVDSPSKKTIVLIHYTFGNHKTLARHITMFNSLGYNTVTFNLLAGSNIDETSPLKPWQRLFFLVPLWTQQITDVLDSVMGDKIIFSQSFPSTAGLISASQRADINGYICDGGPFTDVIDCINRLYLQQKRFSPSVWRRVISFLGFLYLGPFSLSHLKNSLKSWPISIPILSLRGGQDMIVPPEMIDSIFKPHRNLNTQIFEIPEAGHLDGLKSYPEIYTSAIKSFLKTL